MATEKDEINDEWSSLALPYDDVFRPRFEPLYHCIASVVVNQVQSNNEKQKVKLLDYGTG